MSKYKCLCDYATIGYGVPLKGRIYDGNHFFEKFDMTAYELYTSSTSSGNMFWSKVADEKEIIGYEVKEEYSNYVVAILMADGLDVKQYLSELTSNPSMADKFKEAGVLDLWFNPIYKDEFKPITLPLRVLNTNTTFGKTETALVANSKEIEISVIIWGNFSDKYKYKITIERE